MRRPMPHLLLLSTLLVWASSPEAAEPLGGTWMAELRETQLQLHLRTGEQGMTSLTAPLAAFQGLSDTQSASAPFRLEREAGALLFEGRFVQGQGAGHYRFEPSGAFSKEMAALGYPKLAPGEQLQLALFDLGPRRVRELAALGYKDLPLAKLLKVGVFQVTAEHVRALKAAGYDGLTLDELIQTRIHGVTPEYIRQLGELGLRKLALGQLLATRIHGVTPDFIREVRKEGYPDVTLEQLVQLRIHSVDPDFIRSLSRTRSGSRR